jgi:mono/diheme cytochrome c family protein
MSAEPSPTQAPPETEPTAGVVPAPVWLFVAMGVLAFWSLHFLEADAGGFDARVYRPYGSLASVEALQPKSSGDIVFANGQRVFTTYCSVCHQPTGQGLPGQFPPLAESEWVAAQSPSRIIRLVLDGIQGPITVKGTAFNGAMPPWRELLKDEEIAAALTFVRGNKNWGNSAEPVAPEQVKAIRDKVAARNAWAPEELLQVPLSD